ncbi:hypothetical protein SAMN04488079_103236 [Methylophaga sulfidovorans]|uniref:Uncharacterized protein n=2 Tax=Methylophaga sulfidovorans TaxID=45496 RepID=A0A1I3VXQ3_9GAMM|nr:hypothetical protein SAMN04488079_103236 [Methylophaga sulfidovorans]
MVSGIIKPLHEESHAESMLQGNVYLSTLETCRRYENEERGDRYEGYSLYSSGTVSGLGSDPHMKTVASRLGVEMSPDSMGSFMWCKSESRLTDSFILCTTDKFNRSMCKDFGDYCVEIRHLPHFYMLMSRLLKEKYNIGHGLAGYALYKDRWYEGLESPPEPPTSVVLLKPERYKHQREYRFSWNPVPNKGNLKPFTVSSEQLKPFFRRVS